MAIKLGEMLLRANIITEDQLGKALEQQRLHGGKLGYNLVKLGYVKEDDITSLLSQQYGVPAIKLSHFEIEPAIIKLIPAEISRKYQIVPLNRAGSTLTIAMGDPTNVFAMDDIKFITGYNVEPVVASEIAIMEAIDHYYGSSHALELKKVMENIAATEDTDLTVMDDEDDGIVDNLQELEASSEDAPVVKLVNLMFSDALKRKASDIHIEPYEKIFRVRFRIDGILHEVMNPPLKLKDAITSRVKILARLDISEKRLPQDGRIKMKMKIGGKMKDVDVRVSVVPALYGEKVVMRLLDKDYLMLDMTKLGFEPESLERFDRSIHRPYGMILVTGPTGSGKTNTLYSAISRINTPEVNITTAEDPVEFNIAGVNQVQMRENIGLNFAAALRSYLRQDPNIILVGEIRDFETAEIAVKAALTGHLVFSTVHTNDAPSTINRLMNMGIEPFLVSTSVHLIAAQRLVRRICANCKEENKIPPQALIDVGFDPEEVGRLRVFKGRGCTDCGMSGYKGRVGLYEVMEVTDPVKEMILMGASAHELKKQAVEDGMITLRGSGLRKIKDGMTTIEEVVRETVH